ncbi:hypothetical protein EYF80_041229 [Liparis tanakae]|uniref:Uncharacterized protein n=1 Tax=Liparis tanakae TaxID=230148 RepID=A0A4Z2G4R9_9TELE|nr:hypothetical protein EYF80_041229 [Liparis tanakae]
MSGRFGFLYIPDFERSSSGVAAEPNEKSRLAEQIVGTETRRCHRGDDRIRYASVPAASSARPPPPPWNAPGGPDDSISEPAAAAPLMLVPLLKRVISEISPHLKKDYPSEEGSPEIYEAGVTFHGSPASPKHFKLPQTSEASGIGVGPLECKDVDCGSKFIGVPYAVHAAHTVV